MIVGVAVVAVAWFLTGDLGWTIAAGVFYLALCLLAYGDENRRATR